MNEIPNVTDHDYVELTSEIVSAYVANNALNVADLPKLISDVHRALLGAKQPGTPEEAEPIKPAVAIRKSVTPDYLICLEDGKKFKSLKRHLSQLGLTPAEYRQKWGLPRDYPMVAPNYSATRSSLARQNGLGRRSETPTPVAASDKGKPSAKRARKAVATAE